MSYFLIAASAGHILGKSVCYKVLRDLPIALLYGFEAMISGLNGWWQYLVVEHVLGILDDVVGDFGVELDVLD